MARVTKDTSPQAVQLRDCAMNEGRALVTGINSLQRAVHANSVKHGFWTGSQQQNPLAKLMLVTCELAEAVEAIRNGTGDDPCDKEGLGHVSQLEEEFADAIIRILDLAQVFDLNIGIALLDKHEYNCGRSFKHGKTC